MSQMTTTNIVYISAEAIVGAITVVGNLIVLIAIWRTKRLHTITNVFIGNLAMADIAVGVFVAPCAALSYLGLPHSVPGCIFINCSILMFTNVSILMLLTIASERFLAIRFPFVYERHVTIKVAIWTNVSIWIFGSILGLLPMYGWNKDPDEITFCAFTSVITMEYMVYFQFFGLVLVPLVIMFCIYVYILIIVRQHFKQTRSLQNQFQNHQNTSGHSRRFDKDVQAAKLFALLFFLFAIFWLPINIMNSITLFCPSCYSPFELLLVAIVLSHANSSINPFLYAASNSRIKNAIKAMFRMKLSRQESDSLEQSKTRVAPRPLWNNATDSGNMNNRESQQNKPNVHRACSPMANDEHANSLPSGWISFLTSDVETQNKDTHLHNNVSDPIPPQNIQNTELKISGQRQTHFLRDELDSLDRLVPVDGIMANIYDSIDDDTRDIILNKGKGAHHQTQNTSNNKHVCSISDEDEVEKSSEDDQKVMHPPSPMNTISLRGHSNPSFVNDEYLDGLSKNMSRDSNLRGTDEPSPTLMFNRSPHLLSCNAPSFSISQDSTFNFTSDNTVSASTVASADTQVPKAAPSNSPELPLATPPLVSNMIELSPHLSSLSIPEAQYTTRNHIVMESEMDDVMSVKHFHESQEMDFTISYSQPVLDERGILRNKFTQRTKL